MKKIAALILALVMLLTGCSGSTPPPPEEPMRTVIDGFGREVEIPVEVDRVATLFAFTGHVTVMLGEGDKIVATNAGLKRDILLTQISPQILEAATPKKSGAYNIEELVKADPDLVFIEAEDAVNDRETSKFDEFGIPYLVIDFKSIEEQQEMILLIGDVLGQNDRAQAFVDQYNGMLDMVAEKADQIPEEEKLTVYHSVNEAHRTDPADSIPTEWIELIGGIMVTKEAELEFLDDRYFASMEQILEWNPDVILVNEDGVDEYIVENDKWHPIEAVKNDRVFLLPNGISRWGHPNSLEISLGALWTAVQLYPDYFDDVDLEGTITGFYQEFFGMDLTDEELSRLLSGKNMRLEK